GRHATRPLRVRNCPIQQRKLRHRKDRLHIAGKKFRPDGVTDIPCHATAAVGARHARKDTTKTPIFTARNINASLIVLTSDDNSGNNAGFLTVVHSYAVLRIGPAGQRAIGSLYPNTGPPTGAKAIDCGAAIFEVTTGNRKSAAAADVAV